MTDSCNYHDSPDPQLAIYADLLGQVAEYGMAVIGVFPDPVEGAMGFAYTMGMYDVGLPEVIVFGLPPDVSQPVLNDLCLPLVRAGGGVLEPGERDDVFGGGVKAMLIEADEEDAAKYVTFSATVHDRASVPVMQLCWPDANGLWPWQHGCQTPYPLLGEPVLGAQG